MKKIILILFLLFLSPATGETSEVFLNIINNHVYAPNFSLYVENIEQFRGSVYFSFDKGYSNLRLASKDNGSVLIVTCMPREKAKTDPPPYLLPESWPQMTKDSQMFSDWMEKVKIEVLSVEDATVVFKTIPHQKANVGQINITEAYNAKASKKLLKEDDLLCGFLYEAQKQDLSFAGAVILHKDSIYTINYLSNDGFQVFTKAIEKFEVFGNK